MTASPRRARRNALLLGGLAVLMYLGFIALQYARVHHG